MRNEAPLVLVLIFAILVPARSAAESPMLCGKPAEWETGGQEIKASAGPALITESLETPNHRRQRLGLPIESSFPAEEVGVAEETPNHRRHRLAVLNNPPLIVSKI